MGHATAAAARYRLHDGSNGRGIMNRTTLTALTLASLGFLAQPAHAVVFGKDVRCSDKGKTSGNFTPNRGDRFALYDAHGRVTVGGAGRIASVEGLQMVMSRHFEGGRIDIDSRTLKFKRPGGKVRFSISDNVDGCSDRVNHMGDRACLLGWSNFSCRLDKALTRGMLGVTCTVSTAKEVFTAYRFDPSSRRAEACIWDLSQSPKRTYRYLVRLEPTGDGAMRPIGFPEPGDIGDVFTYVHKLRD